MIKSFLIRGASVAVPVALGVMTVFLFTTLKSLPSAKESQAQVTPVRVITLAPVSFTPRVSGYGTVRPAREWRAIARVEGEITWLSDQLENGLLTDSGAELMRIDQSGVRLALAQIDAQINLIGVRDETVHASLEISEAESKVTNAELERQKRLLASGTVPQSAVDAAVRQALSSRANVNSLKNQLLLNEAEQAVLVVQRDIARRELDYTQIHAPFALRIGEVNAEVGQYVSRGQVLFSAEGIEEVEISAQFPMGRIAPLVRAGSDSGPAILPTQLVATVRLQVPGRVIEWPAKVDRIGELIDPRTQSANVVVTVAQPQAQAVVGQRPPLLRNTFVEVELRAPARDVIAIPRSAVRGGSVLVLDRENKLRKRSIEIAYSVEAISVIADGLSVGERLVVSDLDVAVPGRAVSPVEDTALAQRVMAGASGQDVAR